MNSQELRVSRGGRGASGWLLSVAVLTALPACGCSSLYRWVGGDFVGPPEEMAAGLSPGAQRFVAKQLDEIGPEPWVDFHVHLMGAGSGGSGIEIHPSWLGSWNPLRRGRTGVYMSAAGVEDLGNADREFVDRLVALVRTVPKRGKCLIYAMDRFYRDDGTIDPDHTTFYVPNDWALRIADEHPDVFVPVVSIHPYRNDAVADLERLALRGCRFVKWLPNAMNIDPSAERLTPFYAAMVRHGMVLLTHTGRELAVDADDLQKLGNPLRLRKPLSMGVRVVALHAASDGIDIDLDDPARPEVPSFHLLLRLLDEPRWRGLLFAELASTTFDHHVGGPLDTLLERDDLHARIVHGSDYPLPGINVVTRTSRLASDGYITEDEAEWLDEVYGYNPLLFDLLVKRTVRHPSSGRRFEPSVFRVPTDLRDAFATSQADHLEEDAANPRAPIRRRRGTLGGLGSPRIRGIGHAFGGRDDAPRDALDRARDARRGGTRRNPPRSRVGQRLRAHGVGATDPRRSRLAARRTPSRARTSPSAATGRAIRTSPLLALLAGRLSRQLAPPVTHDESRGDADRRASDVTGRGHVGHPLDLLHEPDELQEEPEPEVEEGRHSDPSGPVSDPQEHAQARARERDRVVGDDARDAGARSDQRGGRSRLHERVSENAHDMGG